MHVVIPEERFNGVGQFETNVQLLPVTICGSDFFVLFFRITNEVIRHLRCNYCPDTQSWWVRDRWRSGRSVWEELSLERDSEPPKCTQVMRRKKVLAPRCCCCCYHSTITVSSNPPRHKLTHTLTDTHAITPHTFFLLGRKSKKRKKKTYRNWDDFQAKKVVVCCREGTLLGVPAWPKCTVWMSTKRREMDGKYGIDETRGTQVRRWGEDQTTIYR